MSVVDLLLDTIIFLLNNTILKILPDQFSGLSLSDFDSYFQSMYSSLLTSWNFVSNFIDIHLLLVLAGVIITAEVLLHFGFKGIKYIINVFRGSGG